MTDIDIPSPERIKTDVEHIKDWLSKEPHLTHLAAAEDEEWIETFLYYNKFSLEKTKSKLENLYSLRSKHPKIFKNRDLAGDDLQQLKNHFNYVTGDKLTRDGMQVFMIRYGEDPGSIDATVYLKWVTMMYDLMMLDKSTRLGKFIVIVDLQHFKLAHVIKLMPVAGLLVEITEKSYSLRAAVIHVINLPAVLQKFFEAFLKLLPDILHERVHIHGTNSVLFEEVDKDAVCSDFGGEGPSITKLEDQVQKKLEETREWFQNQGNLCSNEELRTNDSKTAQEMRGSFRKLEVD